MIHFRYLMTVAGGLLHMAPDLDTHFPQLAEAVALGGARDERNRRFLAAFIRPAGLDVPATPAVATAIEQVARDGAQPDPSFARGAWMQPVAMALAVRSRTGVGRWLMNDRRADDWDEHADATERTVAARIKAKDEWQRHMVRRKAWRYRRDLAVAVGKRVKHTWRWARHRAGVTLHRALHVTGLGRGDAPGD
jgi:hypothetical protein